MDPQCIIQFVRWYHEPEIGEKRLIKTGRNSSEPYSHVIEEVLEADFGRYYCLIKNVMGETECTAYLSIKSRASISLPSSLSTILILLMPTSFMFSVQNLVFLHNCNNFIEVFYKGLYSRFAHNRF